MIFRYRVLISTFFFHYSGVQTVSKIFPGWLYGVAFDRSGVVMKHALDIAIILDTMAHNPRLGLEHLMPVSC